MDVIILAGGKGTRLSSAVRDVPKPLAPVAGKPFLEHLIDFVNAASIAGNVIISIGHKAGPMRDWSSRFPEKIILVEETEPLGTGGAIRLALDTAVMTSTVLVMNGDSFMGMDLAAMASSHKASGCSLTIAITEVPDVSCFGEVRVACGRVSGFLEKSGKFHAGLINAGVYMLEKHALSRFPEGASSFEHEVIPEFLDLGINAYHADGVFIDIGTPESYARSAQILGLATE